MNPEALDVRDAILTCTRCPLSATTTPVPFSGPVPAGIVVVGEAPGAQEEEAGKPFVGPSGSKIRGVLMSLGFDLDQVAWVNVASCRPRVEDGSDKGKDRAPSLTERDACKPNLLAQLRLFRPRWVILAGNVALQAFMPKWRVGSHHGRPFAMLEWDHEGPIGWPTFHPSAVLRNPAWNVHLREDLASLASCIGSEDPDAWMDHIPLVCEICKATEGDMEWGPHATVICKKHVEVEQAS